MFGPVVSSRWLREHLDDADLVVIDIRWFLDGRPGLEGYRSGHIPGAVYVDHDREITGAGSGGGRHPLPARNQFQEAMRRAGVNGSSTVVVYDEQGGFVAARLWWTLRYFGHQRAAILDGSLAAWPGPRETQIATPVEGDFIAAAAHPEQAVDYAQVRERAPHVVLLDARPPSRYRGEQEPVDPVAGHIPGARNTPWESNVDEQGSLLTPDRLRRLYDRVGVDHTSEVIAYRGSGARACHVILALESAGIPGAKLYPGSWSDWCSHRDAPVAVGHE
ncbi:sulfurtransferase [Pseudonocardia spinosispora]|uniref:sulfurtransferase n=1 Tax=Pseudonocardia spinosispora TaxID=103441 RepID=UPI0003F9F417|nr:sulfurtransferase [Pseudonocardia spinosispora]